MDTQVSSTERALLAHAERQTKALESIQRIVMFLFALGLVAAAIYLIVLMSDAGVVA